MLAGPQAAQESEHRGSGRAVHRAVDRVQRGYATEIDEKYRESEQQTFRGFLDKLTQLDVAQEAVRALVWNEFPNSIRVLLDNKFVFADFWRFQNGSLPEAEWQAKFAAANRAAHVALGRQDTVTVLSIVLSRIYVLGTSWCMVGRRGARRSIGSSCGIARTSWRNWCRW